VFFNMYNRTTISYSWHRNDRKIGVKSVLFAISYTIGNIIFCIFKNFELNLIIITARVYKLRLAEANFLSCYFWFCDPLCCCLRYFMTGKSLKGEKEIEKETESEKRNESYTLARVFIQAEFCKVLKKTFPTT